MKFAENRMSWNTKYYCALFIWHDDVIKWKYFPRYWLFVRGIHRSPVYSPQKGQWRADVMFSLICARINGWVNHGETDDMGRHRAHYDVIVRYLDAQASQYLFAVSNITCIPIPYSATCLQYRKWESHNMHYHSMVHQSCHFPRYWPLVSGMHWPSVNSPLTGQWRGAFMFTLICVWIND